MSYYITHSGHRINLSNISKDDINLQDIAHHLTKICRYGGALGLDQHYSVAQHSILLSVYAAQHGYDMHTQRALLMHDASEAYLGDVVSGLKELINDYKVIENKVSKLIEDKYSLFTNRAIKGVVKELDTRILLDEARAFVPSHYQHFKEQLGKLNPLGIIPEPEKNLHITKTMFLVQCDILGIKD